MIELGGRRPEPDRDPHDLARGDPEQILARGDQADEDNLAARHDRGSLAELGTPGVVPQQLDERDDAVADAEEQAAVAAAEAAASTGIEVSAPPVPLVVATAWMSRSD